MGIDNKYGKVTVEHPGPDEDEPVIVFRAQDKLVPKVLEYYYSLCIGEGVPGHHLAAIKQTRDQFDKWQRENADRVRVPNSDRWAERTGYSDADS